jgi:anti-anti-sigma factor
MHISIVTRENYAILHLKGGFDTSDVAMLQQEIDALTKANVKRVILNLRLVKSINTTALGAMIKFNKLLQAKNGKLVISRPSKFCRDMIKRVGVDRVVTVFASDEAAAASFTEAKAKKPAAQDQQFEDDPSSVLFTPVDEARIEHFLSHFKRIVEAPITAENSGSTWSGVGRMLALDAKGLRFTWSGGNTELSPFAMTQMLAVGTEWKVKFRLPLLKKGYCEAVCTVNEVEERPDGVKVGATFKSIDDRRWTQ